MEPRTQYFEKIAAAFVRGKLGSNALQGPDALLFHKPLSALSLGDMSRLIEVGLERGLQLHKLKRTMGLARVIAVAVKSRA